MQLLVKLWVGFAAASLVSPYYVLKSDEVSLPKEIPDGDEARFIFHTKLIGSSGNRSRRETEGNSVPKTSTSESPGPSEDEEDGEDYEDLTTILSKSRRKWKRYGSKTQPTTNWTGEFLNQFIPLFFNLSSDLDGKRTFPVASRNSSCLYSVTTAPTEDFSMIQDPSQMMSGILDESYTMSGQTKKPSIYFVSYVFPQPIIQTQYFPNCSSVNYIISAPGSQGQRESAHIDAKECINCYPNAGRSWQGRAQKAEGVTGGKPAYKSIVYQILRMLKESLSSRSEATSSADEYIDYLELNDLPVPFSLLQKSRNTTTPKNSTTKSSVSESPAKKKTEKAGGGKPRGKREEAGVLRVTRLQEVDPRDLPRIIEFLDKNAGPSSWWPLPIDGQSD